MTSMRAGTSPTTFSVGSVAAIDALSTWSNRLFDVDITEAHAPASRLCAFVSGPEWNGGICELGTEPDPPPGRPNAEHADSAPVKKIAIPSDRRRRIDRS